MHFGWLWIGVELGSHFKASIILERSWQFSIDLLIWYAFYLILGKLCVGLLKLLLGTQLFLIGEDSRLWLAVEGVKGVSLSLRFTSDKEYFLGIFDLELTFIN